MPGADLAPAVLASGGGAAAKIAAIDWSASSLGPQEGWPVSLRTTLATMLACPTPMFLAWGPELLSFYNDAYEPILGYRAEGAMGAPFRDLWASIWADISPLVDEALAGGHPRVVDMQLDLSRSGAPEESYWTFSYSPAFDDAGAVAGMLCVTGETTARVLAERQRDLADERMQLALEAGAVIGTWMWDLPSDRFTVDEAFARNFGLDPALGRTALSLQQVVAAVHPDDQQALAEAIAEVVARGGAYAHQYRVRRADGAYYWIEANGRVDHGPDGAALRFPGVLIDVGAKRALESERDDALAELRALTGELERRVEARTAELMRTEEALRQAQKMEAVGQLTGGLAHDFNNLLAGISGALELMTARLAQGRLADVDRYLVSAQGAAKRAAALTHRLLAFSRRQTLAPKPTDINALVRGMTELVQRTAGPGITVETVEASGLWTALVDAPQLENALLNLCINARDAMPDGGRITIETANKWLDRSAARLQDLPEGQYLSLCVTDTGTGMAPEVIARAFEPFYTTKPLGEGTGLGLSMIYGFAKQSGGQVRIYSELGDGTTICIYLPRHYGPADEDAPPVADDTRVRGTGATVLVVDDEPTVRMLVSDVLSDQGYGVIEAHDGPTGLKVLQSDARIDLLITDVGLPGGLNGRQLAEAARQVRQGLRVLFITGYAENAVLNAGRLDPGMQVLTKPFAMDVLATRVREAMAEAK